LRTPAESSKPAEWLAERLVEWPDAVGTIRVGAVVPTEFEAYARLFPSLYVSEEKRLRWAELAAINGRIAHPLMELHLIASAAPGYGPSPWNPEPGSLGGPLPQEELRELAGVLREFTATPELCWYCVWTGYGGIEETETGARIHHPGRDYFVSSGPIEEVTSFDEFVGPEIWWPDDRAWCVGSDMDLAASYLGGSAQCIEALLVSETLEALPVASDDRVDINADEINRGGQ
jgi:hypothetical protein